MIGLDTSVLVRYLTQDEPRQAALATRLIEKRLTPQAPGFIGLVVLAEMCWVLRSAYCATEEELRETVEGLLSAAQFMVERRDVVQAALRWAEQKGDQAGFVDVLIARLGAAHGCTKVVTFDKAAARHAGMAALG